MQPGPVVKRLEGGHVPAFLALPKSVIETLPDNYTLAIRSGRFPAQHAFDPSRDYLPPDLLSQPSEWLEIDTSPEPVHSDQREGHLMLIVWSIRARSYYGVFWRFPDGRRTVEDYLDYLQREGVDWEKSARQGYVALKPDVQQIPVATSSRSITSTTIPKWSATSASPSGAPVRRGNGAVVSP